MVCICLVLGNINSQKEINPRDNFQSSLSIDSPSINTLRFRPHMEKDSFYTDYLISIFKLRFATVHFRLFPSSAEAPQANTYKHHVTKSTSTLKLLVVEYNFRFYFSFSLKLNTIVEKQTVRVLYR